MTCSTAWHFCWGFQCLAQWLFDWQTLITGLLALGAAGLTLIFARGQLGAAREQIDAQREQLPVLRDQILVQREQLNLQREQEVEARDRRLRAARSSLPVTLSTICSYAEDVGRNLNAQWPASSRMYPSDDPAALIREYGFTIGSFAFPATAIEALERMIEFSGDDAVSDRIESILREAQVLDARLRSSRGEMRVGLGTIAAMIIGAAAIYARSASLFGYARQEAPSIDPADLWDGVASALNVFSVHRAEIDALVLRQRDAGRQPGEGG